MASASGSAALGLRLPLAAIDVGYRPRLHDSVPCPHAHCRPTRGTHFAAATAALGCEDRRRLGFWWAYINFAGGPRRVDNRPGDLLPAGGTPGIRAPPQAHFGVICELIISTPRPARYERRKPRATLARADSTAARSGLPRARYPAIDAARVHPAPCR